MDRPSYSIVRDRLPKKKAGAETPVKLALKAGRNADGATGGAGKKGAGSSRASEKARLDKVRKTPAKPGSRKKNTGAAEGADPHAGTELGGLALLALLLATVIALFSEFAMGGRQNLLGPYFGSFWAHALNRTFGSLPLLLLLSTLALCGWQMVRRDEGRSFRIPGVCAALFLLLSMLLSVRHLGKASEGLSAADFTSSGGYLGNYLVQFALRPLFGEARFGAYFALLAAVLLLCVWGFRLGVALFLHRAVHLVGGLVFPLLDGFRDARMENRLRRERDEEARLEGPGTGAPERAETGLQKSPDKGRNPDKGGEKAARAQRGAKPGAGYVLSQELGIREYVEGRTEGGAGMRKNRDGDPGEGAAREAPFPDAPFRESRKKTTVNRDADPMTAGPAPALPPEGRKKGSAGAEGEDLEDGLGEEELDEDFDPNDPLAVRRMRDLDLERKRVAELNDWEVKARNPEIAGLLARERAEAAALERLRAERKAAAEAGTDLEAQGQEAEAEDGDIAAEPAEVFEAADGDGERDEGLEALSEADGEGEEAPARPLGKALRREGAGRARPSKAPKPEVKYDPYRVPRVEEIFENPPEQPLEFTEEQLREQGKLLEAQLINFKVMGKVTQICPGPVITRYEVELAPGVKVNRISTLADDLALALKAKSIRILAPIPGKSVVGIEVPNRKAQIVYIKEILDSEAFAAEEDTLKIGLGKTIGGEPYAMDLTRAPHLLIAGQTGSGKSVCINSIMASFLTSKTPDELRLILVDPKVVELKPYDSIPHLLAPVITQPETAVQALKWATYEMDRRYEVLAMVGVRNIKGFNQKQREGKVEGKVDPLDNVRMPYIVIIIDELADLMMVAGKEVETNIARIAQKARAVGIHLILATQRPSTNVITGTIKANLPTRIAFQVASQIDARTIMDKMGAEKLLGRGDMLFRPIEFPEPIRLHGCYVDDDQAEKAALTASSQHVDYPQLASFNLDDDPAAEGGEDEPRDDLFRDAAELVVQLKQASVSLLQRRLGIGYARSGRLVDQLEKAGVVGRERGSKPREVLMDAEELHSFLSSGLNDPE